MEKRIIELYRRKFDDTDMKRMALSIGMQEN